MLLKEPSLDILTEVLRAEQRIRPHIRETPLDYSAALSSLARCHAHVKLENVQYTGSFKVRGALNKLLSLTPEQRAQGVVTASSGNHGAGVAYGLHKLGIQGTVFVPEHASATKVEAIKRLGAQVRLYGADSALTEAFAREYARSKGMIYISPYNDPQVIGGQGTIAVELARQIERIDTVFVALGGGGLISGIASYLKALSDHLHVVGCSPHNSPVMIESLKAQHIIEMQSLPTLSDGTAGGVEPDAITFPLCQQLVDAYALVAEEEIKDAMRLFMETQHMLIEGAAAVALAAFLQQREQLQGQNVVIIICGANISLQALKTIL